MHSPHKHSRPPTHFGLCSLEHHNTATLVACGEELARLIELNRRQDVGCFSESGARLWMRGCSTACHHATRAHTFTELFICVLFAEALAKPDASKQKRRRNTQHTMRECGKRHAERPHEVG